MAKAVRLSVAEVELLETREHVGQSLLFFPGQAQRAHQTVGLVCRFGERVAQLTSHRTADFRRGRRLGEGDRVVDWPKPPRPRSIGREAYAALPASPTIREYAPHLRGARVKLPLAGRKHPLGSLP